MSKQMIQLIVPMMVISISTIAQMPSQPRMEQHQWNESLGAEEKLPNYTLIRQLK